MVFGGTSIWSGQFGSAAAESVFLILSGDFGWASAGIDVHGRGAQSGSAIVGASELVCVGGPLSALSESGGCRELWGLVGGESGYGLSAWDSGSNEVDGESVIGSGVLSSENGICDARPMHWC
jgi:hypothetical protein